jgi:hypothetical protein
MLVIPTDLCATESKTGAAVICFEHTRIDSTVGAQDLACHSLDTVSFAANVRSSNVVNTCFTWPCKKFNISMICLFPFCGFCTAGSGACGGACGGPCGVELFTKGAFGNDPLS